MPVVQWRSIASALYGFNLTGTVGSDTSAADSIRSARMLATTRV